MKTPKRVRTLCLWLVLFALVFLAGCAKNYEYDDFTFTAPPGFKTKQYEGFTDAYRNADYLLFTQNNKVYFQIFRQKTPVDGQVMPLVQTFITKVSTEASNFQLISQNTIEVNDRPAVEVVYRVFHGEPYVQIRELWMENNGWVYTLLCSAHAIATPGAEIPVEPDCYQLADGFKFK